MHTFRKAPMLIRGSEVHTTRVSPQPVVTLQNQPPNPPTRCASGRPPSPPPLFTQTPPPKPPALHRMPAAVPVVDDFNYVDNASEGPEEVRSDSSLVEEEELGRSTQGWDSFDCVICFCASSWAKFRPGARLSRF